MYYDQLEALSWQFNMRLMPKTMLAAFTWAMLSWNKGNTVCEKIYSVWGVSHEQHLIRVPTWLFQLVKGKDCRTAEFLPTWGCQYWEGVWVWAVWPEGMEAVGYQSLHHKGHGKLFLCLCLGIATHTCKSKHSSLVYMTHIHNTTIIYIIQVKVCGKVNLHCWFA